MVNFLRNHQIVFHDSCTISHSPQQIVQVTISPCPCQRLLSLSFCFNSRPGGCEVPDLVVVLTCISLMTGDVKHHFPVLVGDFCTFGEMSSHLSVFVSWVVFCYWVEEYIMSSRVLTLMRGASISSRFVGCVFTFLTVSFDTSNLGDIQLFFFCWLCFWGHI